MEWDDGLAAWGGRGGGGGDAQGRGVSTGFLLVGLG